MLESVSQGNFMSKNENDAWTFLEDLAENSMQWDNARAPNNPSIGSRIASQPKPGVLAVDATVAAEAKLATLMRRMESLELKTRPLVNQASSIPCSRCGQTGHIMEDCAHISADLEQVNAAFNHSRNDPYASTYNPGWRNHPNLSWSQQCQPPRQQPNPYNQNNTSSGFSNNGDYDVRLTSWKIWLRLLCKQPPNPSKS